MPNVNEESVTYLLSNNIVLYLSLYLFIISSHLELGFYLENNKIYKC